MQDLVYDMLIVHTYIFLIYSSPDPCESKPCRNGGMCKVVGNTDFMCVCPQTFKGKHCDGIANFICLFFCSSKFMFFISVFCVACTTLLPALGSESFKIIALLP